MDIYTYVGGKKMKLGYTTGSCAAAAAKASAKMLFSREIVKKVSLLTPKGIMLNLDVINPVIEKNSARCEIIKHGGDDPDITDGISICCTCEKNDKGIIEIKGGEGIGIVTKKGLSLEVGEYAINKTPREMIERALNEVRWDFDENCGLTVTITVPEGKEVAKKTYNPKLGILDGISIIGTSGIVMPMSSEAIIKTIELEMQMKKEEQKDYICICPGNYGENFIKNKTEISLSSCIKCSNFIGKTLDIAYSKGFKGVLLIGHVGKLIKLGGGIMDTHSRNADCRTEIIASNAAFYTDDINVVREILGANTTVEAVGILKKYNLIEKTFNRIMNKIEDDLYKRYQGQMAVGVIMFCEEYGVLGETSGAKLLAKKIVCEDKYER